MASPAKQVADDDRDKWNAYPSTVLTFVGAPGFAIDLRQPVTASHRQALALVGLDGAFGVFTAENPDGEHDDGGGEPAARDDHEVTNDQRTTELERELTSRRVAYVRVDGTAPDGAYRERCVAARMARADAVAFATRFQQLALFWFDGETFWLLPARITGVAPQQLPAAPAETGLGR